MAVDMGWPNYSTDHTTLWAHWALFYNILTGILYICKYFYFKIRGHIYNKSRKLINTLCPIENPLFLTSVLLNSSLFLRAMIIVDDALQKHIKRTLIVLRFCFLGGLTTGVLYFFFVNSFLSL